MELRLASLESFRDEARKRKVSRVAIADMIEHLPGEIPTARFFVRLTAYDSYEDLVLVYEEHIGRCMVVFDDEKNAMIKKTTERMKHIKTEISKENHFRNKIVEGEFNERK